MNQVTKPPFLAASKGVTSLWPPRLHRHGPIGHAVDIDLAKRAGARRSVGADARTLRGPVGWGSCHPRSSALAPCTQPLRAGGRRSR